MRRSTWMVVAIIAGACSTQARCDPSLSCSARTDGADPTADAGAAPLGQRIAAVSLGERHGCAVTLDDEVLCWGANDLGQLGIEGELEPGVAHRYEELAPAAEVAAGGAHSCAITDEGLHCWGDATFGQLGPVPRDDGGPSLVTDTDASMLTAGLLHTCAVIDERIWCWGDATYGQLGRDVDGFDAEPAPIEGLVDPEQLDAGAFHTCAVARSADALADPPSLWCWGRDENGELGDGEPGGARWQPMPVAFGDALATMAPSIFHLSAGAHHTCVSVGEEGEPILCWGRGQRGELGNGDLEDSAVPVRVDVDSDENVFFAGGSVDLEIEAGEATWRELGGHTCEIDRSHCWGANDRGQLGDGTFVDRPTPVDIAERIDEVDEEVGGPLGAAGGAATCAIEEDRYLKCWGANDVGQLGIAGTDDVPLPVRLLPSAGGR